MTQSALVRLLSACAVVLVLGYGIGYFHRGQVAKSELDAVSRSLMLASASKNAFLLKSIKENKDDGVRAALTTFLYGDLVAIQSSLVLERTSTFNAKACSLVNDVQKSGIEFDGRKRAGDEARQKVLSELYEFCGKANSSNR